MAKKSKKQPPPDASEFDADIAMLVLQYGKVPAVPTRWAIACLSRQCWIDTNGGYYGGCKVPKLWSRPQDAKAATKWYLSSVRLHHGRPSQYYANVKHTPLGFPESWVAIRFASDKVEMFPIDVFVTRF
jgi:hypothetical protein